MTLDEKQDCFECADGLDCTFNRTSTITEPGYMTLGDELQAAGTDGLAGGERSPAEWLPRRRACHTPVL